MIRVVIASNNPVKRQAAAAGFQRMFPHEELAIRQVAVPSGVRDQPMSDAETLQGARQRAENARGALPDADFWVGIEGGVEDCQPDDTMWTFAWVAVCSPDRLGLGRTATLRLPPRLAELVRGGKELGEADDIVFGRTNSKQDNGAVGLLTGNVIDRAQAYEQAVILALIPFKNPDLYP